MFKSKRINKRFSHERAFNAHVGNHTSLYTKMQPLSFTPLLAKDIGINSAILLHQLQYWMNSMNSGKSIENIWNDPETNQQIVTYRKWIRDSLIEWHHILVYMSVRTIRRSINSLLRRHLIMVTSKINRNKYNHTHWYSINYNALNHMFVKKHSKLAKSMHIFPEVRKIKNPSKYKNNQGSYKSLYTRNRTKSGHSAYRYRCGQSGHIEQDKMSTSNRTKCPHRDGQSGHIEQDKMATSISNSSTNSSTSSSRSSIKKPNPQHFTQKSQNISHKNQSRSSTSDDRKIQKAHSKTPVKPHKRQRKSKPSLSHSTLSSPETRGKEAQRSILSMSVGEPTHVHDKHYVDEMLKAYRNTWQDDINPEHSMRIYKSMKHWINCYGGNTCVLTVRRVTGYIRREMFYGDTAHRRKWHKCLKTTASRLRYLGRSIFNASQKDKQVQAVRADNHDYKYGNLPIQEKMRIIHDKENKRENNPKEIAYEQAHVKKLLNGVKKSEKRHFKERYKKEKAFAKKFNNIK